MTINEISTKFLHGTDQDKAEVREFISGLISFGLTFEIGD